MKFSLRILYIFLVLTACLSSESCVYEYGPDGVKPGEARNVRLALDVRALVNSPVNTGINEKVNSLRVIMLGNETIETVIHLDATTDGFIPALADQFSYLLTVNTKEGFKRFYIIANEESVGNVSYQLSEEEKEELDITLSGNFTELLDEFSEGYDAATFTKVINSVYFEPSYYIDGNKEINLPYSAYYDMLLTGVEGETKATFYLVPVATKFYFQFTSYREAPVYVNGISLEKVDSKNFVMARVGAKDYYKYFGTLSYYWIDWLAEVSKASWDNTEYDDNVPFNSNNGWIMDYTLPETTQCEKYDFFGIQNRLEVPAATVTEQVGDDGEIESTVTPSRVVSGPYYIPESQNMEIPDPTNSSTDPFQAYYLTMLLEDTADGEDPPAFEHIAIGNLQALFRNTYVVIRVEMNQGDIEVYAQINEWNKKSANGWVNEGTKPSLIRRKR